VYVDEQLGHFAVPLAAAGHDVVFAGDAGRAGRTDAWHFRQALEQQRVLITFNRRDFEYLHKLWTTLVILGSAHADHSGVVTSTPTKTFTPAEWLPVVLDRLRTGDIRPGHLLRWISATNEWREDDTRPEED
jgi:hypothetical protein